MNPSQVPLLFSMSYSSWELGLTLSQPMFPAGKKTCLIHVTLALESQRLKAEWLLQDSKLVTGVLCLQFSTCDLTTRGIWLNEIPQSMHFIFFPHHASFPRPEPHLILIVHSCVHFSEVTGLSNNLPALAPGLVLLFLFYFKFMVFCH